jgi:hypothetical protein
VNVPAASSNHTTASPALPASGIAPRDFKEIATTRPPGFCARSSSANVGASSRFGLLPTATGRP